MGRNEGVSIFQNWGVRYSGICNYERGEPKPNAEAITKLAKALDTTVDYLMNGTTNDLAENAGFEKEIISRFKQVQSLPTEEKKLYYPYWMRLSPKKK